jgi:hypothetical protein
MQLMSKTSVRRMLEDKKNQNWRKKVELESKERIISHRVRIYENRLNKLEIKLEEFKIR